MKRIHVTLRVHGPELDPDEVTKLLRIAPRESWRRGEKPTPRSAPAKFGMWRIDVDEQDPPHFEGVALKLLEKLTPDLTVWHQLAERYEIDLSCGLWLDGWNDMFSIEDKLVQALADRRLAIVFDIYECEDAEDEDDAL